ncbi:MAG: histidine ammonia-lyase [Bacteroidales bacterium]|nr:histidine ammonia-lyase [Bacteroidales bacterium]
MSIFEKNNIKVKEIINFLNSRKKIKINEKVIAKTKESSEYLHNKISKSDSPIYGINTGFGSLCDIKISKKEITQLQQNLLISHACGTGKEIPQDIIKLMMLLKIISLLKGYSAVRPIVIKKLIELYNNNIIPVIYEQGSLGASGDLVPLSHLSLPLIGLGEVYYKGNKVNSKEALQKANIKPIKLDAKEGLALINGTQFMGAYAVKIINESYDILEHAIIIAALSCDAFMCRLEPFEKLIHLARPHKGQLYVAQKMYNLLKDSEISKIPKANVQDPYSFRCIPQVLGAIKDTLDFAKKIIEIEINSVTDNPLVFAEKDTIISGGNFHGEPLALVLDYLSIALTELTNIIERRINQLISGKRGLPVYLIKHPGINSGFMIAQYTAASIVNENRILSYPASVGNIDSSQGQEDHVSMGANAATKTYKIMQNTKTILAIELLIATQALEFRKPLKTSPYLEKILKKYRKVVPFIEKDTLLHNVIEKSINFINSKNNF